MIFIRLAVLVELFLIIVKYMKFDVSLAMSLFGWQSARFSGKSAKKFASASTTEVP